MLNLTLTEKASIVLAIVVGTAVSIPFVVSFIKNEPFSIAGKEFGFGAPEREKKYQEALARHRQAEETIATLRQQLSVSEATNSKLREANQNLSNSEEKRLREAKATWFPVEDVDFYHDGRFVATSREGKGRWSAKESELSLKLVDIDSGEAVFETNLPQPYNKIRIPETSYMFVPMPTYDYRVSLKSVNSEEADVRIERRAKQ